MVVYPFFTDQFLTKGNLRRLYFSLSAINFIEIDDAYYARCYFIKPTSFNSLRQALHYLIEMK